MSSIKTLTVTWDDRDRPVIAVEYETAPGTSETDVEEWLTTFPERQSDKSAQYLRALIQLNNHTGAHVTLAALADHLGIEKGAVESWNRNMGRSVKAQVRDYGYLRDDQEDGTAQLFDIEWNDAKAQWVYAVPEAFRPPLIAALGPDIGDRPLPQLMP